MLRLHDDGEEKQTDYWTKVVLHPGQSSAKDAKARKPAAMKSTRGRSAKTARAAKE